MLDYADVTLQRRAQYVDMLRSYQVKIDGKVSGEIRAGKTVTFKVSPGRHVLSLAIDWCGSPPLEIDAAPGRPLLVECGSSVSGLKLILGLWYVVFRRNDYLWLQPRGAQ